MLKIIKKMIFKRKVNYYGIEIKCAIKNRCIYPRGGFGVWYSLTH